RYSISLAVNGLIMTSLMSDRIRVSHGCPFALRRGRRPEPAGQHVTETRLGQLSGPADIPVGPDEHGRGSSDRAEYRKLPWASVFSVDQLDPVRPGGDVEAAGLAQVEQQRPGIVQQGEDPQRAAGGDQVEIGHAAPEQRMPVAEV